MVVVKWFQAGQCQRSQPIPTIHPLLSYLTVVKALQVRRLHQLVRAGRLFPHHLLKRAAGGGLVGGLGAAVVRRLQQARGGGLAHAVLPQGVAGVVQRLLGFNRGLLCGGCVQLGCIQLPWPRRHRGFDYCALIITVLPPCITLAWQSIPATAARTA